MAPTYELIYFNSKGRAEVSRYLFAMANVSYKDTRYEKEEWAKMKASTKSQQLPILIVNGTTTITQSAAISRYLAKTFNLFGKTVLEEAKLDSIMCCVEDVITPMIAIKFGGLPENLTKEKADKFTGEILPKWLSYFESELNGNGYFLDCAGGECNLTVGELMVNMAVEWGCAMCPFDANKYPKLAKMQENIKKHPKICEWVKKRPVTEM